MEGSDSNAIGEEINAMVAEDQAMRSKLGGGESGIWAELDKIDRRNTSRMKEIVESVGWPTISRVGEQGCHNAWLLVQHADHDIEFQKYCLKLLRVIADENPNDIHLDCLGFLEDRIMTKESETQKYGTQMRRQPDGKYLPFPIVDVEGLDERRSKLGMEPYDGYVEHFNKVK